MKSRSFERVFTKERAEGIHMYKKLVYELLKKVQSEEKFKIIYRFLKSMLG